MCDWTFSIEDVRKDIKEENYGEKDVQKLLYELEHDTMDYSAYDNAMAIIYYMDLYNDSLKEIEDLNKENTRQQELIGNIHQKWKDKIKEKIDLIDKEYAEIIEKNKNDLYLVNINAQRHSAMQTILEELLGETND